jgi:hypothetical protein
MHRVFSLLSTFALALLAASSVAAAPKAGPVNEGCSGGIGRPVCCKAFVADHCGYTSCCEKGNAAFFSSTHCGKCEEHAAEKAMACSAKASSAKSSTTKTAAAGACAAQTCAPGDASCEVGNRMFFTGAACSASKKAAKSACCASEKTAK